MGNNNSTSSRFGFGRSPRNQSSSAFEFGGTRSSKFGSEDDESTSAERTFDFNSGLTDSRSENLFSSRRSGFENPRARQLGSVKRWSADRGFGFIRRNNGGPDLFCHARSLRNGVQALEEGQTVEYRIQRTDKGEEARDVAIFNEDGTSSVSTERQTGTVKRFVFTFEIFYVFYSLSF